MIQRIKCPKCGELYTKTKPQHVICIDCYMQQVRENLAQRMSNENTSNGYKPRKDYEKLQS